MRTASFSAPASPSLNLDPARIAAAAESLRGIVHRTPLLSSKTFSRASGARIYLKPESLQKAGSWKLRGGYTALAALSEPDRARGVVTFSSGNWAQGVACAAALLGIEATIVLPEGANPRKIAATRGYGARVVIHGRDSEALRDRARELSQEHGSVLINPLDNLEMILGAASLGLELLEQEPETEAIVVPIGGGALIAGVAAGVKALKPDVLVYGVQPEGACAVYRSIEAGSLVELATVETIADGLAVKRPSPSTVAAIERLVDQIVLVSDDEIRRAMYLLLERGKLLVEPSGAASLAGVLSGRLASIRDRRTVVVLTGGNADFGLLARVVGSPTTDGDGL